MSINFYSLDTILLAHAQGLPPMDHTDLVLLADAIRDEDNS